MRRCKLATAAPEMRGGGPKPAARRGMQPAQKARPSRPTACQPLSPVPVSHRGVVVERAHVARQHQARRQRRRRPRTPGCRRVADLGAVLEARVVAVDELAVGDRDVHRAQRRTDAGGEEVALAVADVVGAEAAAELEAEQVDVAPPWTPYQSSSPNTVVGVVLQLAVEADHRGQDADAAELAVVDQRRPRRSSRPPWPSGRSCGRRTGRCSRRCRLLLGRRVGRRRG